MPRPLDTRVEALSPEHSARLHRVRVLSRLLDDQWRIPGTSYRLGLESLLGFIPGVGDAAGLCLSAYILYEASRLGVPRRLLLRMAANIGLDTVVGTVPVLGDIFDVAWKANKKNLALLDAYLATRRTT